MKGVLVNPGERSRKLWVVVATLTTIGLVGPVIIFLAASALSPPQAQSCGNPGVGCYFMTVIGIAFFVLAAVAALGLWIFWYRSLWGPLILVVCNLSMMGFYGLVAPLIYPGDLGWAAAVVVISAAPTIASALAFWAVLTRGRLWVRAVEFVIITLIALPLLWLYGSGLTNDVRTALTPPPAYSSAVSQGPPQRCGERPGSL